MKKRFIRFILTVVAVITMSSKTVSVDWIRESHSQYILMYTEADRPNKDAYVKILDSGIQSVQSFFGDSFKKEFHIYIHPDRQALDKQWQQDWKMPEFKSECWMVASGVATKVDIISPAHWDDQACEHSYSDETKTQQLITHELFHVFHGQRNASPDFSDVTNIDWFVEGFATYASGQLTASRIISVKEAIANNSIPTSLDNFWTGKNKYGLSGSVIKYIAFKFGNEKLKELLVYNKKEQILGSLKLTEKDLLSGWAAFIRETQI